VTRISRTADARFDTVSFLSDFGSRDEFAGVVRAVIRDLAPHVSVIDLTHDIAAFDIRAGSLALARAISYVPSGVVLAIVDPGVGSSRRAVAIEVADGEGVIVGPDNGLLAPAVSMAGGAGRAVVLTNDLYHLGTPGATFAGRDIFAPVVANLCNGVDLAEFGDLIEADLLVPGLVPLPREDAGVMLCEVLWVDRYGNCQLNVGPDEVAHYGDQMRVSAGDMADPTVRVAARATTYSDVGVGAVGLVVDSSGMLALVLDRRSAAEELSIAAGDQVVLAPLAGDDRIGISSPVTLRRPDAR
jgi:S-adenosyl-L-methionine hydrolase (adenosine-forming)